MNVISLTWVCLSLFGSCFAVPALEQMPKLRLIDRQKEFLKTHPPQPASGPPSRKAHSSQTDVSGDDFIKEYHAADDRHQDRHSMANEFLGDINFETEQIKETIEFIEFKMAEVNALIKECIERHFTFDSMSDPASVKLDCAGSSYQILIYNYREGMKRVKDVLIELIKVKLPSVNEDYDNEIAFFVDLMDQLVDSDFKIEQTLKVAKKASKYYVSPRLFDRIIENAQAEIIAFTTVQNRLRGARNEVQRTLEEFEEAQHERVRKLEQTNNEVTRRWNKQQVFRKLSQPSEYVGDYLNKPKSKRVVQMSSRVNNYLNSKEGSAALNKLIGARRAGR